MAIGARDREVGRGICGGEGSPSSGNRGALTGARRSRAFDAVIPKFSPGLRGRIMPPDHKRSAVLLGALYMVAAGLAAVLPFLAFRTTGLLVLVPTALWVAPGLRTDARRVGNLSDGVVGWPGLTTLICGAASLAMMALGDRGMAAAWLASLAACGVIEMMRAGLAKGDNVRAESGSSVTRRM